MSLLGPQFGQLLGPMADQVVELDQVKFAGVMGDARKIPEKLLGR